MQIALFELTETTGRALTVMVVEAVFEQLLALVTVTVYVCAAGVATD